MLVYQRVGWETTIQQPFGMPFGMPRYAKCPSTSGRLRPTSHHGKDISSAFLSPIAFQNSCGSDGPLMPLESLESLMSYHMLAVNSDQIYIYIFIHTRIYIYIYIYIYLFIYLSIHLFIFCIYTYVSIYNWTIYAQMYEPSKQLGHLLSVLSQNISLGGYRSTHVM